MAVQYETTMSQTLKWRFALAWLLLGAAIVVAMFAGSVTLTWQDVLAALTSGASDHAQIVRELRLPRVLLALSIGAALAVAGCAYQALFRNPLADPFVIGASGGAALGATLAAIAGLDPGISGMTPIAAAAFVGTLAAVALVYGLGGTGYHASPLTLLLAGAAISTVLGAIVSLLLLTHDKSLQMVYYWLLGGFSGRGWSHFWGALPYLLLGTAILITLARPLDALTLGDVSARALGLHLGRTRAMLVLAASLTTAAAVAVGGVIGFVGLMAPHLGRLLFGSRHAVLLPASAMLGAILLIFSDLIARTAMAPVEIPVGVLTSLLGGPFFLYVLKRRTERL